MRERCARAMSFVFCTAMLIYTTCSVCAQFEIGVLSSSRLPVVEDGTEDRPVNECHQACHHCRTPAPPVVKPEAHSPVALLTFARDATAPPSFTLGRPESPPSRERRRRVHAQKLRRQVALS